MNYDQMKSQSAKERSRPDNEEHRIQSNCVTWFRLQYPKFHHNLFAVPNGGLRNLRVAQDLKSEGVISGISDLILLKSNRDYGALLIEMKTSTGVQSENQKRWQEAIEKDGYKYVVCHSLEEFIKETKEYLSNTV